MSDLVELLNEFILGQFKWTMLGAVLALSGLFVSFLIGRSLIKDKRLWWLKPIIGGLLVILFVWYGHELVDPLFHQVEDWYTAPLGEPLDLKPRDR